MPIVWFLINKILTYILYNDYLLFNMYIGCKIRTKYDKNKNT